VFARTDQSSTALPLRQSISAASLGSHSQSPTGSRRKRTLLPSAARNSHGSAPLLMTSRLPSAFQAAALE
jgi:hypothetical protein